MQAGPFTATASLSSRTIRPGQALGFTLTLDVQQGYHIYGRPIPEGYVPLRLVFEDVEGVCFGEVNYPEATPYYVEVLNEELHVYTGRIVLRASLVNKRKEAFTVRARLEYQACDERECYVPEEVPFELPLEFLDNVRD
ncbi:MAG: protein-disulfide reductase DsbD family protein [bacterium]|nr:protein-disulfide reductase DsbD family protein [bacterium]